MSVIFGIQEGGKIVIAGDKRGSTKDGKPVNDNMSKVAAINEHLAFASAGNAVFGTLISMTIRDNASKENLNVDELAEVIRDAYQKVRESKTLETLKMPSTFSFLIAGKNQRGRVCLLAGSTPGGKWDLQEVEMMLYPPEGTDFKQCCDIFARNYKLHHDDFVERTIREISDISPIVSPTGDKWIYVIAAGKGTLYSF